MSSYGPWIVVHEDNNATMTQTFDNAAALATYTHNLALWLDAGNSITIMRIDR